MVYTFKTGSWGAYNAYKSGTHYTIIIRGFFQCVFYTHAWNTYIFVLCTYQIKSGYVLKRLNLLHPILRPLPQRWRLCRAHSASIELILVWHRSQKMSSSLLEKIIILFVRSFKSFRTIANSQTLFSCDTLKQINARSRSKNNRTLFKSLKN